MKKYKVLKELKTNEAIELESGELMFALKDNGFIEELPENTRWRAEGYNGTYWLVDYTHKTEHAVDFGDEKAEFSHENYSNGNYFKSQETAEKVAEALKLFFEELHTTHKGSHYNPQIEGISTNLINAILEAKRVVLEDDKVLETRE